MVTAKDGVKWNVTGVKRNDYLYKGISRNFNGGISNWKTAIANLREMGIDTRLLGKRRINSIVQRIKQYELRPEGCEDKRRSNAGWPATKDLSDLEKIKRLEQRIAYLKQENEFLKKTYRWIGWYD
ncbi:HTH domain-containing protein [Sporomusa ovata]|uniref:HTH domain-containing protein n=1 Tax=Sporomusa ovata TaxID=2378 RepID=UPI00040E2A7A|nr:HTH domain-containing protein [Sporomusa ovata]